MEVSNQPKLSFNGVDIINVVFKANAPRGKEMNVNVECNPVILLNKKKKDVFSIIMDVKVDNVAYFELSLRAIGKFRLASDITEDVKSNLLTVNAPAIMFPYIRSFITTFTANLGNVVGTLIIPPQFFSGEMQIMTSEN